MGRARTLPLSRWLHALAIPEVGETVAYKLAETHASLEEIAKSRLLRDVVSLAEKREDHASLGKRSPGTKTKAVPEERLQVAEEIQALEKHLLEKGFAKINQRKDGTVSVVTPVGPVVAEAVLSFFDSPRGRATLKRLSELGIFPCNESGTAATTSRPTGILAGKSFVLTGTLSSLSRSAAAQKIRAAGGAVTDSVSSHTTFLIAGAGGGAKRETAANLGVPVLDEASFLALFGQELPAGTPQKPQPANVSMPPAPSQGLLF